MDGAIALDLNGKFTLRSPLGGAVVMARTGWADTIPVREPSKPGDSMVLKAWIDGVVALSACPQEFHSVADWYLTDLHVGIYEAA